MIDFGIGIVGGVLIGCGVAWLLIGIVEDWWFAFKWSFAWILLGIVLILFNYLLLT